jgi:hypothetical protein
MIQLLAVLVRLKIARWRLSDASPGDNRTKQVSLRPSRSATQGSLLAARVIGHHTDLLDLIPRQY